MNKLNFTKQRKISPSSIQDAVPSFFQVSLERGGCSPAGRTWQEGWFGACSPALELWLASLAVPTLLPELVLASGWAAWAQLRGRWEAARGTAVGRRRGPCGRQQESCWWWHSGQCHRNLLELPAPAEQSLDLSVAEYFERKVTDFKQTNIKFPGCGQG